MDQDIFEIAVKLKWSALTSMSIVYAEERDSITEIEFSNVSILHGVPPALHAGCSIPHLHYFRFHLLTLAFYPSMESFSLLGTVK